MGISFSTLARLEISFIIGCITTAVVFVVSLGNVKAFKACLEYSINKAKHGIVAKAVRALWSTIGLIWIFAKEKDRWNDDFLANRINSNFGPMPATRSLNKF